MKPVCICEHDPDAVAVARWMEFGEPPFTSHDWYDSPEWAAMQERALAVEETCQATLCFPSMLLEAEPGMDVHTVDDPTPADIQQHEYANFVLQRAPIVRGHGPTPAALGDEEHGYILNPRTSLNEEQLEKEYGFPRIAEEREFVRESGYIVLDDQGEPLTHEVEEVGFVFREYRRREAGREPWMPPETFAWHMKRQRADDKIRAQRAKIIKLLDQLGYHPELSKLSAWIESKGGYDKAIIAAYKQRQLAA